MATKIGLIFLIFGLFMFVLQIIGNFKFQYVLNRMHTAAMGDTLGIGFSMLGLMFLSGFQMTTVKLGFILLFFWLAAPVSSHLMARMETTIYEHLDEQCELPEGEK